MNALVNQYVTSIYEFLFRYSNWVSWDSCVSHVSQYPQSLAIYFKRLRVKTSERGKEEMPGKVAANPLPPSTKQPGLAQSLLFSGSRFQGHQKSKGNRYDVEVVLQVCVSQHCFEFSRDCSCFLVRLLWLLDFFISKHVDDENAFLCGYLKIKELTEVSLTKSQRTTYSILLPVIVVISYPAFFRTSFTQLVQWN